MNERIRKLADQAGADFMRRINYNNLEGEEYEEDAGVIFESNESFEKFAELIVRECAIICETVGDVAEAVGSGDQARYSRETAHGCAGMIKDMFGVE